ncbi:InlB B-repeat-containing protein [Gryllotalpicola reticulitermitis]|uniref:InlB B-repeat-containing protein n=1 Tax=Gryllotalpicola reticulitermitis TaxID=1184153 RepID=A0ABV8Q599_9MICO
MLKNIRARVAAATLAAATTAFAFLVAVPAAGAAAQAAPVAEATASATGASTATPVIEAGTPIKIDFSAPSNEVSATNWIGFYYNQTPGASCPSPSTYWQYTSTGGTSEPAAGTAAPASGTLTFPTTGWKAGNYAVYLCYNDGYTAVGSAITVTVLPAPDVLNTDFASGAPVDHAQGLTATTYGTPTIANDPGLGQDVATFNGSTDAYQYDFSSQYSKLASGLTLDCEFRWNGAALSTLSTSAYPSICSGEQSGGVNIEVYNDKLNASIDVGGYKYAYAAADAVQPGTWYDAVATWDGSTLSLYLNGALVASTPASGSLTLPASVSQKWTLGADVNGSGGIEATAPVSLAHSRIWSTPLSATQVGDLYGMSVNGVDVTTSGQGTASATPAQAAAGATVTLSETPADGYHFAGWTVTSPSDGSVTVASDGTFTMPAQPVALTATFAADGYTVHFDGNGASGTMADEAFSYDQTAALTPNAFTESGEQFAGWATSADGNPVYQDGAQVSELSATDGAVVTLYAVWIPVGAHLVDVTSAGHGTASAPAHGAVAGSTVKLTATPDTGYHLTGWNVTSPSDGSVKVASNGTFTMPAANVAVQAQFAANSYTVKFNGNGATVGSMSDITLSYDTPATLPTVGFVRDGYMLSGWATSATGAVAYAPGASVENLTATENGTVTLYAVWVVQQAAVGSWPSLDPGFVTDTFKLPAVAERGQVDQQLLGLWNGAKPTMFTKVSGSTWLNVNAFGVVTGTVPASAPGTGATITVTATNGTTSSTLLVEVPVLGRGAAPQVKAATWNAWNDGANVTDAVGKNLAVIAARGIDEIGFQSGGAAMATQVASALGWNVRFSGDLGIVSAYPFTKATEVVPTSAAPALGATVDIAGQSVQLWSAHLDETTATVRDAQAAAVSREISKDASAKAPAILLGDLVSSSESSVFTRAGLTDSYRAANRNASTDPGDTLLFATPSDRVDYVDYTPSRDLSLVDSDTLSLGWPSATTPAGNSWASNHRAVVSTFTIG